MKSSPILLNGSVSDAAADTVIAPEAGPPLVPGVDPLADLAVVEPPPDVVVSVLELHPASTKASDKSSANGSGRWWRTGSPQ
jgi:hypothetical protein